MNLSGRSAEIIVSKYMRKTYRPSTLKTLLTCPPGTIIWVLMGGGWSFQIYYTRKMVYGYHQLHQIWKKKMNPLTRKHGYYIFNWPWVDNTFPSLPPSPPPKKNRKNPSAPPLSPTYKKNKMIVKSYQFDLKKKFRKLSSFYILERDFEIFLDGGNFPVLKLANQIKFLFCLISK